MFFVGSKTLQRRFNSTIPVCMPSFFRIKNVVTVSISIKITANNLSGSSDKYQKRDSIQNLILGTRANYIFLPSLKTVAIAQLVRASDCGSEGRGFEPHWPPKLKTFCLQEVFYFHSTHHSSKSSVKRNYM